MVHGLPDVPRIWLYDPVRAYASLPQLMMVRFVQPVAAMTFMVQEHVYYGIVSFLL